MYVVHCIRLNQSNISEKERGGGGITICVVLDQNGGNVMRHSSSQNSHFEKLTVDFIDQLVANLYSMFPS
jgi:hypothetical protein